MKTILDKEAAVELELYAENTYELYKNCTIPTINNLKRKHNRGIYDRGKAVKAWEHVAERAAKMYAREFDDVSRWHHIFNAATRRAVAQNLESVYYNEYISGT